MGFNSAKAIVSVAPELIKVPSAINTNFKVLDYLCKNYSKIHISLGMTKKIEEEKLLKFFKKIQDLMTCSIPLYILISCRK